VRDVLRLWAGALSNPRPTDLLRWRQRTGYDYGYLATREHNRVEILHRLLSAFWNGKATIVGSPESPERVNVKLDGGVTMTLPLQQHMKASSWGSLLREYELWALDDDDIHRQFCAVLLRELPAGVRGPLRKPHKLYTALRDMADKQVTILEQTMAKQGANQQTRTAQMRAFWEKTLPAAREQEFEHVDSPYANLRALEEAVDDGVLGEGAGDGVLDEDEATGHGGAE
jgi:hypothetical protein